MTIVWNGLKALWAFFVCFQAIVVLMAKRMAVLGHPDGVWGVAPGRTIYILDLLVRTDTVLGPGRSRSSGEGPLFWRWQCDGSL